MAALGQWYYTCRFTTSVSV